MPLVRQSDLQALLWCQELQPQNEELLCGICFSLQSRRLFLHCGHHLCSSCTSKVSRPVEGGATISCPLCRLITVFSRANPLEPNRDLHRKLARLKRAAYTHEVVQWLVIPDALLDLIRPRPSQPEKERIPQFVPLAANYDDSQLNDNSVKVFPGTQPQPSTVCPCPDSSDQFASTAPAAHRGSPLTDEASDGEAGDSPGRDFQRRHSVPQHHPSFLPTTKSTAVSESFSAASEAPVAAGLEHQSLYQPRDLVIGKRLSMSRRSSVDSEHSWSSRTQLQDKTLQYTTDHESDSHFLASSSKLRGMGFLHHQQQQLREKEEDGQSTCEAVQQPISPGQALRQELLQIALKKNVCLRFVYRHPSPFQLGFPDGEEMIPQTDLNRDAQQRAVGKSFEDEASICPACGVNHLTEEERLQEIRAQQAVGKQDVNQTLLLSGAENTESNVTMEDDVEDEILRLHEDGQVVHSVEHQEEAGKTGERVDRERTKAEDQDRLGEDDKAALTALLDVNEFSWPEWNFPMLQLRGRWIDVADAKQQILRAMKEHTTVQEPKRSVLGRLWDWIRGVLDCCRSSRQRSNPRAPKSRPRPAVAVGGGESMRPIPRAVPRPTTVASPPSLLRSPPPPHPSSFSSPPLPTSLPSSSSSVMMMHPSSEDEIQIHELPRPRDDPVSSRAVNPPP